MRKSLPLLLMLGACAGAPRPAAPIGASPTAQSADAPFSFAFDPLDDRPLTSDATRGKLTVLAFVTTYDLDSQAQVNFLVAMAKHDGDKVNYGLVALQPPEDRRLVEIYAASLHVSFPVALADKVTLAGVGPLGELTRATIILLDSQGRVVWSHIGPAKSEEIRAAMRHAR